MQIINISNKLYNIRLQKDPKRNHAWNYKDIAYNTFRLLDFNLAVRYDDFWTDFYSNSPPYSEYSDEEILQYLSRNGEIIKQKPFIWKFNNSSSFNNIKFGFINADRNIIAKINKDFNSYNINLNESDDEILNFWSSNSEYFFTTLIDYIGYVIISEKQECIDRVANILIPNMGDIIIKRYMGDNPIE